ncbi:nucleotidyltransferase [Microbacterium sp. NPDC089696]|uniref:nucleotidyltransferase n=1 Tax=Microbacterium sp. NPDC089696 TaxID=3364199 RepID=UPI00382A7F56
MDTHRPYPTIEQVVNVARTRIQVTDNELGEARARRAALARALHIAFPGSRHYFNGSIAHGDALTPLTDVDLGIVVPNPLGLYGPGKKGPSDLQEHAANIIRRELADQYPDLRIEFRDRKRSILIRFRDPIRPGQPDFTADVIIAIDNPSADGLYIPRFTKWDRSHPEKHTQLIADANTRTHSVFARTIRLLKHWNRMNGRTLCTWNIKALALDAGLADGALITAMRTWFDYAIISLQQGETRDPAHVSDKPISLNATRAEVLRRLRDASARLEKAAELDQAGFPVLACKELADMFNDEHMLPSPSRADVLREGARFYNAPARTFGAPALITSTPRPTTTPVRSWGLR